MLAFGALSDPTRRRIVELLAQGESSAGAIGASFSVSQPAVSQHLRKLKEAGLVRVRADGQRRLYAIDPEGLRAIDDWLGPMRRFWEPRMDRLEEEMRRSRVPTRRRP